jgi:outer membrane protein assembly factor BamC
VSRIKVFDVKFSASPLQTIWLVCLVLGLTACGSVTNSDKINYKTESSAKPVPLDIPPDLTQLSRDTRFSVPGGTVTASSMGTKSTAAVPTAAKQINDARIERDGQQRWIVIKRPPEEIWPIVHSFWIDNGFTYTLDQQELGILETEWAENRAKLPQDFMRKYLGKVINSLSDTGLRDKFRTRLERNSKGEVEIYISHRGLSEEYTDALKARTAWKPRPTEPELEIEFMNRLLVKLGVALKIETAEAAPVQAVTAKAAVVTVDGLPNISISDSFDVAWRRIGLALDRTGFTVEDRDRVQGTYFVRFVDTTPDERGFFARMFSKSKAEAGPVKYRLKVLGVDTKTLVSIQNANGQIENSPITQRIMKLLVDDLK